MEKGIQNSHVARSVNQVIQSMWWTRTSRLSIKNSPSVSSRRPPPHHSKIPLQTALPSQTGPPRNWRSHPEGPRQKWAWGVEGVGGRGRGGGGARAGLRVSTSRKGAAARSLHPRP